MYSQHKGSHHDHDNNFQVFRWDPMPQQILSGTDIFSRVALCSNLLRPNFSIILHSCFFVSNWTCLYAFAENEKGGPVYFAACIHINENINWNLESSNPPPLAQLAEHQTKTWLQDTARTVHTNTKQKLGGWPHKAPSFSTRLGTVRGVSFVMDVYWAQSNKDT